MNILILSCGSRNKIIQYFKKALKGNGLVIGTDMSELAPAVYEADKFYKVPSMIDKEYINIILDICKKEKIKGVLSLIDPELSLLALNESKFKKLGVLVIGSTYDLCEMSLDKFEMYNWLSKNNYKCAKSFIDFNDFESSELSYPVFVKPVRGSASLSIANADNRETAQFLFKTGDNMMVQEFLSGQEIGADVYIDLLSEEVVSIFTKKKLKMRAGETDKAVSFKDECLFDFIENFVKKIGYRGQIDIDIFEVNGEYYISEVNPRFGGGYPHAYECGADHMSLIIKNLNGEINRKRIGDYKEGVFMLKYNEIMVLNNN